MFLKKISILAFVIAFFVLLSACNDKPTGIGAELLPSNADIKTITTYDTTLLTGNVVYAGRIESHNRGVIHIGAYLDNSVTSILRYDRVPDSLSYLTENDIDSVILTIYPERYALGDTVNGYYGFDIFKVSRRWSLDTTSWDSLFVSPRNYFDDKPLATYEGRLKLADTMSPVSINLPKSLMIDWFRTVPMYDSVKKVTVDSLIPNWGIALVPKPNTNVVFSFGSQNSATNKYSVIRAHYRGKNAKDTVSYMYSALDKVFFKKNIAIDGSIVVQNGANIWSKLQFDLSMIPPNAGIHKAQLDIVLDSANSYHGNNKLDTIIQALLFKEKNEEKTIFYDYTAAKDPESNLYRFPSLTSAVQKWNLEGGKGQLIITPYNMINLAYEMDKLVFFGPNHPDSSKRPVLKVIYSTIKSGK